jgi:hypothetical protein
MGTIRADCAAYLHPVDFIWAVCRSTTRDRASEVLRRLVNNNSSIDSDFVFLPYKFSTETRYIRLMNVETALKILMLLPGPEARKKRARFAQILLSFYAVSDTLILQMGGNAGSMELLNTLARELMSNSSAGNNLGTRGDCTHTNHTHTNVCVRVCMCLFV